MKQHPVARTLSQRMDESAEEALIEIKDLKKDLAGLERALKSKAVQEFPLLDIVHAAYEINRRAGDYFLCKSLLSEMDGETKLAEALALLERFGATKLKKPAGWHWISPKGEMHKLAPTADPIKAAAALERLRSSKSKTANPPKESTPAKKKSTKGKDPA